MVALVLSSACTAMLGIDGNYVAQESPSDGGRGGESASGTGGAGGAACGQNEKICNTTCVPKDPTVGCGRELCNPCPTAPDNATLLCVTDYCDFQCDNGYVRAASGTTCELAAGGAPGTGGSVSVGGASGAGGVPSAGGSPPAGSGGVSGGPCVPSACTCKIGFKPCCFGSQCGCEYVFACAPGP